MSTSVDILGIRRRLDRTEWEPPEPFGPDGWRLQSAVDAGSVIVTVAEHDGVEWIHASIAWARHMPSYDDLVLLHSAVWARRGYAYQVFVPEPEHVNIHPYALHLWGRLDGKPALPTFSVDGSI